MYAGCPISWTSKMQTEIALSTTETEYVALSQSMREVIPLLRLLEDLDSVLDLPHQDKPHFRCTVWEDNRSAIRVAESPKFTPRTKHIALKYHHFRRFVEAKTIIINPISTHDQLADIFTKPLPDSTFVSLRQRLLGW